MNNRDLRVKIKAIRDGLNKGLIGRKEEINLILLAMLSGENILLIGKPGTAKSEMSRRIENCLPDGSNYFEYLLTKFTTPEEIFGGISIPKLKKGKQERMLEGYLSNAHIGFLDEIFKANSSILNSLLTIANERIYHDGARKIKTPLRVIVGASNELPTEKELEALYDRFVFRKEVLSLDDEKIIELLESESEDFTMDRDLKFTFEELDSIKEESKKVKLGRDAAKLLRDIRKEINSYYKENKIDNSISDRRMMKIVKILKVLAYTNGRKEVNKSDFYVLENILWDRLEDRLAIKDILINLINGREFSVESELQDEIYSKISELAENIFGIGDIDIDLSNLKKMKMDTLKEIQENVWLEV